MKKLKHFSMFDEVRWDSVNSSTTYIWLPI